MLWCLCSMLCILQCRELLIHCAGDKECQRMSTATNNKWKVIETKGRLGSDLVPLKKLVKNYQTQKATLEPHVWIAGKREDQQEQE